MLPPCCHAAVKLPISVVLTVCLVVCAGLPGSLVTNQACKLKSSPSTVQMPWGLELIQRSLPSPYLLVTSFVG